MKIFAWLTVIMGMTSIFVVLTSPYTFLFFPALIGWFLALSWVGLWSSANDKAESNEKLLHKARKQNDEFTTDIVNTLKTQADEIKHLRDERRFLMLTLEEYLKGKMHDRKN